MKHILILLFTCAAMDGKGQDTSHTKIDTLKFPWVTGGCNGCMTGKFGETDNTDIKFYKTIPDSEAKKYIFMQGPPTTKYDTVKVVMLISDTSGVTGNIIGTLDSTGVFEPNLFYGQPQNSVIQLRGYEVFIEVFKPYDPDDRHVLPGAQLSMNNKGERIWIVPRQHFEYLDENKSRLNKNILVWGTK